MEQRDCFKNLAQKKKVFTSLLKLIDDTPLTEVSVNDICTECGISRSTFYRIFSNVSDIPYWYQLYCAHLGCYQIGRFYTVQEGHAASLELLKEAYPIYRNFFRNWDFNFSAPSIRSHFEAMTEVLTERDIEITLRMKYELDGIARISHMLVERWFNSEMNISINELTAIIDSFYPERMKAVFNSPPNPKSVSQVIASFM